MPSVQRREFLRRLAQCTPVAAGAAVVTATAAKTKDAVDPAVATLRAGVESLQQRVRKIDERIETLEAGQKKWLRVAVGAAALSLGLDVSALL